jgi:hypothetical protein
MAQWLKGPWHEIFFNFFKFLFLYFFLFFFDLWFFHQRTPTRPLIHGLKPLSIWIGISRENRLWNRRFLWQRSQWLRCVRHSGVIDKGELFDEKNQRSKISCQGPFKVHWRTPDSNAAVPSSNPASHTVSYGSGNITGYKTKSQGGRRPCLSKNNNKNLKLILFLLISVLYNNKY